MNADDLFDFATNTGSLYRDMCKMARLYIATNQAPDSSPRFGTHQHWYDLVHDRIIPAYRREVHADGPEDHEVTAADEDKAAADLREYYVMHVRENGFITRSEYLTNSEATHSAYYGSVINAAGINPNNFRKDFLERVAECLKSDDALNNISLAAWDSLAYRHKTSIADALAQHGDFWTIACGVCVMKEAARRAVKTMNL